ncbi:MAG: hypothetical protein ABSE55_16345 [Terracidiphilus sp.]|jgi:hypothetical protein
MRMWKRFGVDLVILVLLSSATALFAQTSQSQAAVTRAENAWSVLQTAAEAHDIDPALLAAVGVYESQFSNKPEIGKGHGMGVFQLTNQPGVTAAQAYDLTFAANYAANMLSDNMSYFSNKFPAFTPDQLLQATVAGYNRYRARISGDPNMIDAHTTGNNYGSNVMGLMSCFQQP